MIKSNFNTEYHAPKCKVIALCPGAMYLEATSDPNKAGDKFNPVNDEEDY